ncbi:MAG: orotidine-5'-phosphate decarboxylase [Gammaproteobacteria bacterium]|jgi:orotidine-5'-phosphate decarboxylase
MTDSKVLIVALDFDGLAPTLDFADRLDPQRCRVKVGKELFTRCGPEVVRALHARGFEVFLDLKFHDIPNTVAGACRAAADLGCWMMNVHSAGGGAMLEAARGALEAFTPRPLLVAVTVLTSLDTEAMRAVGIQSTPGEQVGRLAALVQSSGLDGVVCSPLEIQDLRKAHGPGFLLVTPGIRPAGSEVDDQARVATPESAVAAGASYLVVGRPVTRAPEPAAVVSAISAMCETARAASPS